MSHSLPVRAASNHFTSHHLTKGKRLRLRRFYAHAISRLFILAIINSKSRFLIGQTRGRNIIRCLLNIPPSAPLEITPSESHMTGNQTGSNWFNLHFIMFDYFWGSGCFNISRIRQLESILRNCRFSEKVESSHWPFFLIFKSTFF